MKFTRNIYDYDWRKLLRWLTPFALRQPKFIALIQAAVSPIQYVYALFGNYKLEVEYELTITPQVCYLRKALNDRFDFLQRRIKILPGVYYPPLPLFLKVEGKHQVLYTKAENKHLNLYEKSETVQFSSDFIIQVPLFLNFNEDEMRAYTEKYCLPDKIFTIKSAA